MTYIMKIKWGNAHKYNYLQVIKHVLNIKYWMFILASKMLHKGCRFVAVKTK